MVIETRELGLVELDEADIIRFSRGLYGFEEVRRFALLGSREDGRNPFLWLQCVDSREPCFAVIDPRAFFGRYDPPLSKEDRLAIGLRDPKFLRYVVLATVPRDVRRLSFNLKCPVVINSETNTAMQIILEDPAYPIRYYPLNAGAEVPPCL